MILTFAAVYLLIGFAVAIAVMGFILSLHDVRSRTTLFGWAVPQWLADLIVIVAITVLWPAPILSLVTKKSVLGFRITISDD